MWQSMMGLGPSGERSPTHPSTLPLLCDSISRSFVGMMDRIGTQIAEFGTPIMTKEVVSRLNILL